MIGNDPPDTVEGTIAGGDEFGTSFKSLPAMVDTNRHRWRSEKCAPRMSEMSYRMMSKLEDENPKVRAKGRNNADGNSKLI